MLYLTITVTFKCLYARRMCSNKNQCESFVEGAIIRTADFGIVECIYSSRVLFILAGGLVS